MEKKEQTEKKLRLEIERLKTRLGELERSEAERKQLDYIRRGSEGKYKAIIESQTDLVCRYTPDTTLTFVNNAYFRYFGRLREELIGSSFMPFVVNENEKEKIKRNYKKLTVDHPVVMYDGPTKMPEREREDWQHWSNKGIFDNCGNLVEIQSVGRDITDRKKAETALQKSEQELRQKMEQLEHKNIALAEVMEQIGYEKNQLKKEIKRKSEEILIPVLAKLDEVEKEEKKKYISLLERSLQNFLGSFGRKISGRNLRLSPRELEISNMIKSGFSTKEIANILNVSVFTVQGHRSSIRKKLKIINEKANLATFLQSI